MTLTLTDVSVSYDGTPAVRGASLELPDGQVLGVLGPNGSGKSTLVAGISGLEHLTSGELRVGEACWDDGRGHAVPPGRRQVGLMTAAGDIFGHLDALENIVQNPAVGLLFLIPGVDETLRVNGSAQIRTDAALREPFGTDGRLPTTVLVVSVQEAFLHCAKALMRSNLWAEDAKSGRGALPTLGEMLNDQLGLTEQVEPQEVMMRRYRDELY